MATGGVIAAECQAGEAGGGNSDTPAPHLPPQAKPSRYFVHKLSSSMGAKQASRFWVLASLAAALAARRLP